MKEEKNLKKISEDVRKLEQKKERLPRATGEELDQIFQSASAYLGDQGGIDFAQEIGTYGGGYVGIEHIYLNEPEKTRGGGYFERTTN